MVGDAGRPPLRHAMPVFAMPVGATHWVALRHSCRPRRSWPPRINGGRRGAPPLRARVRDARRGDPLPLRHSCRPRRSATDGGRRGASAVGATHWVALRHSCQPRRSWPPRINGGRRGAPPLRHAMPVFAMPVGATHWVALRHSCRPRRSWPPRINGGRRGASPLRHAMPVFAMPVGATHWVALRHSCRPRRSWPPRINGGRRGASPD